MKITHMTVESTKGEALPGGRQYRRGRMGNRLQQLR